MSLKEVFKRIEAFKKDMEAIGIPVSAVTITPLDNVEHDITILLRTFVKKDIEHQEAED